MKLRMFLKRNTVWICLTVLLMLQLTILLLSFFTRARWLIAVSVLLWLLSAAMVLFFYSQIKRFHDLCDLVVKSEDMEDAALEAAARGGLYITNLKGIFEQLTGQIHSASLQDKLKVEAELHALQNQINPHFLYNTLEVIRSLALSHGANDVSEMAESLALQFRYCINSPGEMVFLQQELDHIHNYMLIQHYRFGDRFQYRQEIDESDDRLFRCRMPVLTLQPLVENALLHGIAPRVEGGTITLRVFASSSRLHIVVEDNGVGISEDELRRIRTALQMGKSAEKRPGKRSVGIGIMNVNSRIRLYFGDRYGVDITSTIDVGTSVFVTLPLTETDGGAL